MKLVKRINQIDFEELGYATRLEAESLDRAKEICALRLHEYERDLVPAMSELGARIEERKSQDHALHAGLYDRPIPANDAAMLVRTAVLRTLAALAIATGVASFAGNVILFLLFGFGTPLALLLAAGTTGLLLAVGHLAYEKIVAHHRMLQVAVILGAAMLCAYGVVQLGQARRVVLDRLTNQETAASPSYVDHDGQEPAQEEPAPQPESESKARETLGGAMFLVLLGAELAVGLLAGFSTRLRNDEDYAAWRELKKLREELRNMEKALGALIASIETAKLRCMAGILRAESVLRRHRPPYFKALAMLVFCAALSFSPPVMHTQAVEHYEGILIDTSGSIARKNATNDLFREYLVSAKRLLLTEPSKSRVIVSVIATDSFGGGHEILKGRTPETHGVFTDDLTRARRELAAAFEAQSSGMSPVAAGTDIIGGLWHMKTLFESGGESDARAAKEIWIFSDMMNETADFNMPGFTSLGPERMMDQAKAKRLLVPLRGYTIHVQGAATAGLTPQEWLTIKRFWDRYFAATGAHLVAYSPACDGQR